VDELNHHGRFGCSGLGAGTLNLLRALEMLRAFLQHIEAHFIRRGHLCVWLREILRERDVFGRGDMLVKSLLAQRVAHRHGFPAPLLARQAEEPIQRRLLIGSRGLRDVFFCGGSFSPGG